MEPLMLLHVFAGILSLVSGFLVFCLAKGTQFHIRIGKVYYLGMLLVFLTSIYVSIVKVNWFLLLIGIFSFYLVQSGLRMNSFRKTMRISPFDKLRVFGYGLAFLAMVVLALVVMKSATTLAVILLAFGLIGISLIRLEFNFFVLNKASTDQKEYLREHVGRMTGSYIAAFTAFLVNNISFLPPLVVWLGPTVLGFGVIWYFSRPYQKS
jgi:uncharacterized membrane protein